MDIGNKILDDREIRSNLVHEYLNKYNVVTIKSNFPSTDKNDYCALVLVGIFEKLFDQSIFIKYINKERLDGFDGRAIIYCFDESIDASKLKVLTTNIEEEHMLGRYIDIDVYDFNTKSVLSRGTLRKCYLCDKPANVCMREHNHDINEILDKIEFDINRFLGMEIKKLINYSCMLELNLKFKFGLVTPYHNHSDMDMDLMQRAQKTILYPFLEMFDLGFQVDTLEDLNYQLHIEGKRAEYLMYKETKGINAYKGLIFLLGMFLGALGYSLSHKKSFKDTLNKLNESILDDYKDETLTTFGAKAYRDYGFLGARGEAKNSFINVFNNVDLLDKYSDDELYRLLISLVKTVDDTVLLKRSGSIEKYNYYKKLISEIDYKDNNRIQEVTLECERNNISIGGCADIFIITVFYSLFKRIIDIESLY